jgi:serine/threonine protein kinase
MKELGEGQFGKVHLMKAKNICGHSGSIQVAVKILSNLQVENMKTFYEEMEVMKQFTHSNIVSFLGICSEVEDGAPMIILELMEFGDLKNFLIQHGPSAGHSTSLTTDHFYKFAADISSALSFLASKQYVHRDIAARNCLVGHGLCVKLADFGLARAVHEKDYYRVKKGSMLPLRWMAPESVKYGIFTLESDIW